MNAEAALSNDQIRQMAPSVFAAHPVQKVSRRYAFLPTASILEGMREAGWLPVQVTQKPARAEWRVGYQKHLLHFAHADSRPGQEVRPQILITNSHDGLAGYTVRAGLYRFVCMNGLVVGEPLIEPIHLRHTHFEPSKVIEASLRIAGQMPRLTEEVESFRGRELSAGEAEAFAKGAHALRWKGAAGPVPPLRLLDVRRSEDAPPSLWCMLNRIQENLLKGGQVNYRADGRGVRTRAIRSIDENVRINAGLWALAVLVRDRQLPDLALPA